MVHYYQSSSICAINAEDGNRGLDFGRGSGSEGSDGGGSEGEGSLRSGDSGGAENLSREHDGGFFDEDEEEGDEKKGVMVDVRLQFTWRLLLAWGLGNFRALDALHPFQASTF